MKTQNADISLYLLLADHWDKSASELPEKLRELVPVWWDSFGVEKRQE